ncbi:hypothetical protein FB451DRAFT_1454418, partial [Mycena latifolia]
RNSASLRLRRGRSSTLFPGVVAQRPPHTDIRPSATNCRKSRGIPRVLDSSSVHFLSDTAMSALCGASRGVAGLPWKQDHRVWLSTESCMTYTARLPRIEAAALESRTAVHAIVVRYIRSFSDAAGDAGALPRCLRNLKRLTKPSVEHTDLQDDEAPALMAVLSELIPSSSSIPPVCFNLTHLRLIHCNTTYEYHPVLKTLIESRCLPSLEGVTPLQKLTLVLQGQPGWDICGNCRRHALPLLVDIAVGRHIA